MTDQKDACLLRIFVVEIIDTEEKIDAFMPLVDDAIAEGLATIERVQARFYRKD